MPTMSEIQKIETGESLQNPQENNEATQVESKNEQSRKVNEKEGNKAILELATPALNDKEENSNKNKENEGMINAGKNNERNYNNPSKRGRNVFNKRLTLEFNEFNGIFGGESYPKYLQLTAQSKIKPIELEDHLMRIYPSAEMSFKRI